MSDFTPQIFVQLLQELLKAGYTFMPFGDYIENPSIRAVILRHDVDAIPGNSLKTAKIEQRLGITGTYYFRIVPQSNQPDIIRNIASLGHEIGYHYEDLALCRGNMDVALKSFEKNLNYFRKFYPVKTICMHGSPLSKFDNRHLWKKRNYKDFGITGEPYFDVDFSKVLYLTDTGRRWDGEKVSIRDRVVHRSHNFHSTFEIIGAAKENLLPDQIMITIHPQRWTNNLVLWTRELVMQNIKNQAKRILVRMGS
jgi:hypothetical protein